MARKYGIEKDDLIIRQKSMVCFPSWGFCLREKERARVHMLGWGKAESKRENLKQTLHTQHGA